MGRAIKGCLVLALLCSLSYWGGLGRSVSRHASQGRSRAAL